MDQKKIGCFIAELRKEKEWTQAELGERLGITNKTVSRWETGSYMPDISMIQALCKEFDIGVNEFLSGERLDNEDFRTQADQNVVSALNRESRMRKEKTISDFLGGAGTGSLISTLYSPDSTIRTVVIFISIAMILTSWYFRARLDKNILSGA